MRFSLIIPVYNRPDEIRSLLLSLEGQTYRNFEVIIVEDGSTIRSDELISAFGSFFDLRYFYQENAGQGFARNYGMDQACGDFFVILDSDVQLPPEYLSVLQAAIDSRELDAFGGPDRAAKEFSKLQKAMDFAMTSFWTTGGIRGKMKKRSNYQARGYNMGVSAEVYTKTGGFVDPNRGEDIEWSIRIKKAGFKLELVDEAYVFHQRKSDLRSFIRQSFSFGQNRINVSRYHPEAVQLVHLLPLGFLAFLFSIPLMSFLVPQLMFFQLGLFLAWSIGVFTGSYQSHRSIEVSLWSWVCSVSQLTAYGLGFLLEWKKKAFSS
ncbi:glycosyltransferase family 2 protein [Algoriphagus namhaensis]